MPQQCCSLGINITVVNRVIGSNLKCFWFLHLATILILLRLFFCRRRKKKKAFHFSGFLFVGGVSLSVREVGVRVPIDFSGACSTRPQKTFCHLCANRLQEEEGWQENV